MAERGGRGGSAGGHPAAAGGRAPASSRGWRCRSAARSPSGRRAATGRMRQEASAPARAHPGEPPSSPASGRATGRTWPILGAARSRRSSDGCDQPSERRRGRRVRPTARPAPNSSPSPKPRAVRVRGPSPSSPNGRPRRASSTRLAGNRPTMASRLTAPRRPPAADTPAAASAHARAVAATVPARARPRGAARPPVIRRVVRPKPRPAAAPRTSPSRPPPVASLSRPKRASSSPDRDPLRDRPDQGPARGAEHGEGHRPPGAHERLGRGEAHADAGRAHAGHGRAHEDERPEERRRGAPAERGHREASEQAGERARRGSAGGRGGPARSGQAEGTPQAQADEGGPGRGAGRGREERHAPRPGDVPPAVPQVGPGSRVARGPAEPSKGLGGAERVQLLRGLPRRVLLRRGVEEPRERRFPDVARGRRRRGHRDPPPPTGPRPGVVVLLDDRAHELVTVTRDGPDEDALAVLAERAPQRPDRLGQGAVGDHHVRPHAVEDLLPVQGHRPLLDEQEQQVEVARDERHLPPRPEERTAGGREGELREAVARRRHPPPAQPSFGGRSVIGPIHSSIRSMSWWSW